MTRGRRENTGSVELHVLQPNQDIVSATKESQPSQLGVGRLSKGEVGGGGVERVDRP